MEKAHDLVKGKATLTMTGKHTSKRKGGLPTALRCGLIDHVRTKTEHILKREGKETRKKHLNIT